MGLIRVGLRSYKGEFMMIYIVRDVDGSSFSINSVYDVETFKKKHVNFLNKDKTDWGRHYDVVEISLNLGEEEHQMYHMISVSEVEGL
jgi:hypothetical protein